MRTTARLVCVSISSTRDLPSSIEIEIQQPDTTDKFKIAVNTTPTYRDIAWRLSGPQVIELGQLGKLSQITFYVHAEGYEAAIAGMRSRYGEYFALDAPEYLFDIGDGDVVVIVDRVPGDHLHMHLSSALLSAERSAAALRAAATAGELPDVTVHNTEEGELEITLAGIANGDYLSQFAKIARLMVFDE